jgi:phage major head subunit gpT-like protein
MIISTQNLRTLNRGFRTLFLDSYQGGAAMIAKLAMRTTSSSREEFYGWLGAVPGMRELIDEVHIRNIVDHNFSILNKEFESTIGVKRADIERDRFGVYNPLFQAMGIAARQHPDELLANKMIAGFTELSYTGKAFFGTNHAPKGEKKIKFSNKGLKKLSAANFRTAKQNIKSRLNAEGRPMNLGLDLVLVVSPTWEETAREILLADRNANGATNTDKGTAKLEVWPQLSANEDAWFLFEMGYPVKPFIHQVEVETEFASLDNPEDTHVFLKKQFLHQAYGRGNVGFGLPELAYGSTGENAA